MLKRFIIAYVSLSKLIYSCISPERFTTGPLVVRNMMSWRTSDLTTK